MSGVAVDEGWALLRRVSTVDVEVQAGCEFVFYEEDDAVGDLLRLAKASEGM